MFGEAYAKCSRQLMQPPLHLPVCSMMLLKQRGWLSLQTRRRKNKKRCRSITTRTTKINLPANNSYPCTTLTIRSRTFNAFLIQFVNCEVAAHKGLTPQTMRISASPAAFPVSVFKWNYGHPHHSNKPALPPPKMSKHHRPS